MALLNNDLRADAQELRETHISWVFLHASDVFKIKKPVRFGFLDFSTPELRKAACKAELELNRRLASDVYRDLVPITRDDQGRHALNGAGPIVDWAVHMRRLSDASRADNLLEKGLLDIAHVDRLAARVAEFHQSARCDSQTTQFGSPEQVLENVLENFNQSHAALVQHLGAAGAAALQRTQLEFIASHKSLFAQRMTQQRVRDGHGDLKLEHCYFEKDQVLIIDCIEFNDRFRYADVCCDLAFLAMDLCDHHRVDLAERLLSTYALISNDYDLYSLIDFYQGYRACVRGKVQSLLAADASAPSSLKDQAIHEARRHFLLAVAEHRPLMQQPALIAVGGIIASGKSTFADQLAPQLGASLVSSDRVRKYLLQVQPTTRLHHAHAQGAYDSETTSRVYEEVLRRARVVLQSGRSVVLDCSFRAKRDRLQARALADELGVPFWFVECRASVELCRSRLAARSKSASVSDGRLELLDEFIASWQPVNELSAQQHLVLDTAAPLNENLQRATSILPAWPAALRG